MFSLIVVLITIVLVALIALACMYFGGTAFQDGGTSAAVTKLLNEGAQVSGAALVYHAQTGDYAPNVAALIASKHLTAAPQAGWQAFQDTAVVTGIAQDQCLALNAKQHISGIPLCTDPAIVGQAVCCEQASS